jgi:ABC-type multidrug transport system fused ATPase/permease subunit
MQLMFGFITAVIIAFTASWLLSIVLFACFPFIVAVGFFQIRLLRGRSAKNKELIGESGKIATEVIDNIRTVASLSIEDKFYNQYNDLLKPPFKANVRSVFGQAFIFALAQASIFYLYSAGFSLGAFLIISDPSAPYHARYTDILRVYAAVVFTALSIGRASSFLPDAQKAQSSASRIFNLIKRVPEIDNYSTEGEVLKNTNGHIEVKNAQFVYPSRPEVPVLQGLSVSVQPGDTLALVGPSGCGKSTVISLIERFYDPLGGCLQLEGHDLRDLNIRWLRNQIGIVSQEPVLFDASIADNIRYGANFRDVSDEEIVEAAKAANIHNFIGTLPEVCTIFIIIIVNLL